ncbi:TPA: phage tail protein [Enterobacter cloacae]
MAEKYYSILTNRGKELEAQSSATGKPVIIKDFVVGDGNGQPVKPDPAQTKLVREVFRNAISALQVSPDQANQFIAQLVLATGVGGFVVREVGLLTDAGELYSVANCAAIEKPENGVSVNLQYRLAVSETASIELKVATGDGLFLRQDANLSDVKDASLSRKSLGLKGAAVLDVGKVANTVAAGDDTRIVNALQKNNNLSELADKVQARANLQLKTAAQKDVVTSKTDATADRVLTTGWMSLGGYGTDNMIAGADAQKPLRNGFYGVQTEPTYGNAALISFGYDSGSQVHIIAKQGGQAPVLGVCGSTPQGVFGNWGKIYTEFQKPTAGDVDAVSASQGGVFQKHVTFNQGLHSRGKITWGDYTQTVGSSSYNALANVFDSTGNYRWAFGPYQNSWSIYAYNTDGSYKGLAFGIDHTTFNATVGGTITPGNYSNFDARYVLTDGATYAGFVNGDATRPYMRHRVSNAVVELAKKGDSYTKTETEARYQPKGNYTPAGQAYTKAESDARYQLKNTASRAANGWFKDTTTGMIYQWGRNASSVVGNTTVTFPIAFPNACLNVQNTLIRNSGSAGERPWGFVTSFNNTSVNLSSDATGSYWYAIGY